MSNEANNTHEATSLNPFGSQAVTVPGNASAAAVVQREVAEVQAAMVIAKRYPRDPIAAMDRILQSCTRPTLAHVALYQYAKGGTDVTGPSIRMAEELARQWGNIVCGVTELSRSGNVSECMAYAWDLETNFRDEKRFQVKHWRDTKGGGYALREERDIYELIANQGARRKRACILAVIPGDVQEAAVKQCDVTLRTKADLSPERIKSMVEKFAGIGVSLAQLEKRIQRRIDSITPALAVQLGRIFNSISDGMSTVDAWFEAGEAPATAPEDVGHVKGVEGVKAALRKRGKAQPAAAPAPAPAQDVPRGTSDPDAEALEADRRRSMEP